MNQEQGEYRDRLTQSQRKMPTSRDALGENNRMENSYHNRRNTDGGRLREDPYAPSIVLSSSGRSSQTTKPVTVKHLRSWNLQFSGSERDDSEEFLERLAECIESADNPVLDILRALPCILNGHAARWYRTIKKEISSWEKFERAFRGRFLRRYDKEDLLADLRQWTQGKGEKVAAYLTNFRYIITRFARPPPEHELARIAYRNLHPEYRKAMSDKIIETFSDIEYYGQLWEEQKELDSRYSPPPAADKMRVKGAAFETPLKAKVAVVDTEGDDVCAIASSQPKNNKNGKQQNKQQSIPPQTATPKQTTAEVASTSDAEIATLARKLLALMRPEMTTSDAKNTTSTPKANAWAPRQGNPGAPLAREGGAAAAATQPFASVCGKCNKVGHTAYNCTTLTCYNCNEVGHISRECPKKRICQVCNTQGFVFSDCPNCKPIRDARSGNECGGEQK